MMVMNALPSLVFRIPTKRKVPSLVSLTRNNLMSRSPKQPATAPVHRQRIAVCGRLSCPWRSTQAQRLHCIQDKSENSPLNRISQAKLSHNCLIISRTALGFGHRINSSIARNSYVEDPCRESLFASVSVSCSSWTAWPVNIGSIRTANIARKFAFRVPDLPLCQALHRMERISILHANGIHDISLRFWFIGVTSLLLLFLGDFVFTNFVNVFDSWRSLALASRLALTKVFKLPNPPQNWSVKEARVFRRVALQTKSSKRCGLYNWKTQSPWGLDATCLPKSAGRFYLIYWRTISMQWLLTLNWQHRWSSMLALPNVSQFEASDWLLFRSMMPCWLQLMAQSSHLWLSKWQSSIYSRLRKFNRFRKSRCSRYFTHK